MTEAFESARVGDLYTCTCRDGKVRPYRAALVIEGRVLGVRDLSDAKGSFAHVTSFADAREHAYVLGVFYFDFDACVADLGVCPEFDSHADLVRALKPYARNLPDDCE